MNYLPLLACKKVENKRTNTWDKDTFMVCEEMMWYWKLFQICITHCRCLNHDSRTNICISLLIHIKYWCVLFDILTFSFNLYDYCITTSSSYHSDFSIINCQLHIQTRRIKGLRMWLSCLYCRCRSVFVGSADDEMNRPDVQTQAVIQTQSEEGDSTTDSGKINPGMTG